MGQVPMSVRPILLQLRDSESYLVGWRMIIVQPGYLQYAKRETRPRRLSPHNHVQRIYVRPATSFLNSDST